MKKPLKLITCLLAGITASSLNGAIISLTPANFPVGTITALDVNADGQSEYFIEQDLTLSDSDEYILEGITFVNNGAILTIPAETVLRGQPRSSETEFNPGALVITREGSIDAVGTASGPIIFTTAAKDADSDGLPDDSNADGFADRFVVGTDSATDLLDELPATTPLAPVVGTTSIRKLWGGVIILGSAPTNLDGVGNGATIGEGFIEGLPVTNNGKYGGINPNDDSGILQYVSIRHGGAVIGSGNEINGLTLGGVGFGTTIDHVEVYCNEDDGIEFFGGTVNTSNMVVNFPGDDGFDIDQGYTGLNQFWFCLMSGDDTFGGDHGAEWDGDDFAETGSPVTATLRPFAYPTIYNATFIGGGTTGAGDSAVRARNDFGGQIFNSIFANFPGTALDIDNSSVPGADSQSRFNAGTLVFRNNVWWNFNWTGAAFTNTASGLADSAFEEAAFDGTSTFSTNNQIVSPGFVSLSQSAEDGLNPVPLQVFSVPSLLAVTTNNETYTTTFFNPVGYKGAFSNAGTDMLWTTGWTAMNLRGILVDFGNER